jgi:signal transduction histidine kinase
MTIAKNDRCERSPLDQTKQQGGMFLEATAVSQIINALPYIVLILNNRREVVFSNRALMRMLNVNDQELIYGLRPGEVMNCLHAYERDGCGTTEFSRTCGANKAILASFQGKREVQECRILQKHSSEALDLQVMATPIFIRNERFTIFTVMDISHEKRRKVLERVFFHDILNTVGAMMGYLDLLKKGEQQDLMSIAQHVNRIGEQLLDEIMAQKQLVAAEDNDLSPEPMDIGSLEFLEDLLSLYRIHPLSEGRSIALDERSQNVNLYIDIMMLRRVLITMLKNALEASEPGESITLGCREDGQQIIFWVHNPKYIPRETQLQIFKRSFSTKGEGRGLGTYSMRLLSERYLHGQVSFTSSEANGTVFTAAYPISNGSLSSLKI